MEQGIFKMMGCLRIDGCLSKRQRFHPVPRVFGTDAPKGLIYVFPYMLHHLHHHPWSDRDPYRVTSTNSTKLITHPRINPLLTSPNYERPILINMEFQLSFSLWTFFLAWFSWGILRVFYNVFLHPLRAYPGPLGAKATTWWKTYIEVWKQESMVDVLFKLHREFGLCPVHSSTACTDVKSR